MRCVPLLAGLESPNDEPFEVSLEDAAERLEDVGDEPSGDAQKHVYDFVLFSGLIIGTAIFVAVGMYFGETV